MMEFEDQHEVEEEEEMEEEEEDYDATHLPPTNYESSLPNSSSRPFKMPSTPHSPPRDEARSPSPPPLPLSLSFPTGKKAPARYRECLKNHAVGLGGHAVDGCCEFMPAGPDGSIDALKCAACNCHRNFHRKEVMVDPTNHQHHHHHPQIQAPIAYFPHPQQQHQHQHPLFQFYPYGRASAAGGYPQQQRPLALPSTSGGGSRGGGEVEEAEMISEPMSAMGLGGSSSSGKKRFRTKFTAEQKEKMLELAEKVGWRLQKQDEPLIHHFCEETGVKRHVLKVWMHNNKHTLGKRNPTD